MKPILWRASLRHLRQHPWQLSLAILGVGLGVAVMVAIDIASGSAQRAFELSSSTLTGEASHVIESGVNGRPDAVYKQLRLELRIRQDVPQLVRDLHPALVGEDLRHVREVRAIGIGGL